MSWLSERVGAGAALASLRARLSRPLPPRSAGAVLGGVALLLVGVQVFSGILLAVYYVPAWDEAHASVARIAKEIPWGWLVRSVHVWSAHLLVAVAALHLIRSFARGSYGKPREATWLAGVALFALLLAAAFTGQVLPMDMEGVNGAQVASGFADAVKLGTIFRGGPDVGPATLGRVFAAHVLLVPLAIALLAALHLALVGKHRLKGAEALEGEDPRFLRWTALAALATLGLLAGLAFAFPVPVGPKADPLKAAEGVKPLWMFLPVYQGLKLLPAWAGNFLPVVPIVFLAAVPFLKPRALVVSLGLLLLVGAIVLGVLGARS